MHVGTLRLSLHIEETFSLKDKRRVLQSLMSRLRNDFNIAIAEVAHHDDLRSAEVGIAFVAGDGELVEKVLEELIDRFEAHPDVWLEDWQRELFA